MTDESKLDAILAELAQVPFVHALLVVAGLALVGELVLLIIAIRRASAVAAARGTALASSDAASLPQLARISPVVEVLAAAGPVLVAAIVLASMRASRLKLWQAFVTDDPATKLMLVKRSFDTLNALMLGMPLLVVVLLLAAAAGSLHASARLRRRGLEEARRLAAFEPAQAAAWLAHPGAGTKFSVLTALSFAGLGLAPFLVGASSYAVSLIKTLAGLSGLDTELKLLFVTRGMEEARQPLDRGAWIGTAGLIATAVVAAIVMAVFGPERRRRHMGAPPAPAGRQGIHLATAVFALATVVSFMVAQPIRAENRTAWPGPAMGAELTLNDVPTPAVDGPDQLVLGPIVTVMPETLLLNGMPGDERQVESALQVLNQNYALLNPGQELPGIVLVICAPDTEAALLGPVLSLAERAGYPRPHLIFAKRTTITRPLLGRQQRWSWRAAEFLLGDTDAALPKRRLALENYATCGELARAVVDARRAYVWPQIIPD